MKDEKTIADLVYNKISKFYPQNQDKERILLVGHSGNFAGAEILLKNIIQELTKQDVEIAVIVKHDGPIIKSYEKNAPTFVIEDESEIEYYVRELSKHDFKSAIVNTVVSGNFIPYLKKHGFYVLSLVHELPTLIKSLKAENLARIISTQADLVVFPAKYVVDKFETLATVENKIIKAQGIYNTYDNFNTAKSRQDIMKKYDIPEDNHIILTVGQGAYRKGFDLFIEISKILENDKYTFILVGDVAQNLKQKYSEDISSLSNLILTGFISNNDEMMSYYDACDAYLLLSREDPFPSVVLEAFNAKRPVIAFENAGGFQDIVINDVSGYLVEFESVNQVIDKIKLVCSDENLKKNLGDNAKEICKKYDFVDYVAFLKTACSVGKFKTNQHEVDVLKNQIALLKNKNKVLTNQNKELLSSSSWKITKPLRKFKHVLKNVRGK